MFAVRHAPLTLPKPRPWFHHLMTDLDSGPVSEMTAPERAARRGRPVEMTPLRVLERIRQLASRADGLFRIHRTHSALYARARRQFGSWADAVAAAGVDYSNALDRARQRSIATRRRRRRARRTET
jgi:hypothetical protein